MRHFRVVPARTTVGMAAALLAGALAGPATALATGWLVGRTVAVARGSGPSVLVAPLALIGAMIAYELLSMPLVGAVRARAVALVDGAVAQRIRQAIGRRTGVDHIDSQAYRDLAALPTSGQHSIGIGLLSQLVLITSHVGAATSAFIVASVSPAAAAAAFTVLIAKRLYLRRLYAPHLADWGRSMLPQLRTGGYWQAVGTTIGGAKEVRAFGFAETTVERFYTNARVWPDRLAATYGTAAVKSWPGWIAEAVAVAIPLAFVVQRGLDGAVSAGKLAVVAGAILSMRGIGAVDNATYMVEATLSHVAALDELEALSAGGIAARPRRSSGAAPPVIIFDKVAFAYPGTERPVFEQLDLELTAGRSVALVGENGVGKTTLIKLLCRFFDPDAGTILADGVDIRDLPVEEWRARLAVVFQNFKQYHLTARHNIALADWHHPERDRLVSEAVATAGALDIVAALPSGLDTVLSRAYRGGADLSGGQWQRIALARALYAAGVGADVLALDEPTAHLDVGAEIALFDQLLTHAAGKTAIVVSHRYSTVRRAERVVVLSRRGVVEDGTHDELVARGGTYAELYTLQADAFTGGLR